MNAVVIENLLGACGHVTAIQTLTDPSVAYKYEHAGIWPGEPTFIMSHPIYGSGHAFSHLYPQTSQLACVAMDHMGWLPKRDMIETQYLDQLPPRSDRAWFDHRWGGTNICIYMLNTTGAKLEIYDQTVHDDVKVPLTVMSTHDFVANTWITIPSAQRYSVVADPGFTWSSFLTSVLHSRIDMPIDAK